MRIIQEASVTISSISTFTLWGCWEEKREQEIENLFEKILTENFPHLVKEIDMKVQQVQRVPNKINPPRPIPGHIIIKIPKVKDKERILKAARERQLVTYKRAPIRLMTSQMKYCRPEGLVQNIQSDENQGPTTNITLPSKAII